MRVLLNREARRAKRQKTLRDMVVRSATRARYAKVVRRWLAWVRVREAPLTLRSAPALLGGFVEEAYQEGDPMSGMQDLLAGAQLFWPALLGTLRWPWRLLRTWARAEPVRRPAPIPGIVATAIAGSFLLADRPEAAALTLVGFHCLLRSGELFAMRIKDITYTCSGGAVVVLPETKSGFRKGAQELVLVRSRAVIRALQKVSRGRPPAAALLPEMPGELFTLRDSPPAHPKTATLAERSEYRELGASCRLLGAIIGPS